MKIGKIDNETLERLVLRRTGAARSEVIVGPGIGEDCAVLDFGEYECVLSTDPITAGASRVGELAVHISCNDVASNGVEPMAVMLTVLLPPSVTEDEVGEIARQADAAAKELGVQIIGGHTEITDVVTQPVISAVAIGRATKRANIADGAATGFETASGKEPERTTRSLAAQGGTARFDKRMPAIGGVAPGDLIGVTKKLALEGTALAVEKRERELRPYLTDEEIEHAKAMINEVSVVKEGVIAGRIGVKAMHDVTEGGALGAVWEICAHAGTGAELEAGALPFDEVTMTVCAVLGLDPMRLISSGSMMIIGSKDQWDALDIKLAEAGIGASVIGRVTEAEHGITLIMKNGEREAVGPPGPDEIYKV